MRGRTPDRTVSINRIPRAPYQRLRVKLSGTTFLVTVVSRLSSLLPFLHGTCLLPPPLSFCMVPVIITWNSSSSLFCQFPSSSLSCPHDNLEITSKLSCCSRVRIVAPWIQRQGLVCKAHLTIRIAARLSILHLRLHSWSLHTLHFCIHRLTTRPQNKQMDHAHGGSGQCGTPLLLPGAHGSTQARTHTRYR